MTKLSRSEPTNQLTNNQNGFTLIELLIVIVIIGVLATLGIASYRGLSGNSRDAKRKVDVDAIAKAFEAHYNPLTSTYDPYPSTSPDIWFSSGEPKDPSPSKLYNIVSSDSHTYYVCASLEGNTSNIPCSQNSQYCYCKKSVQDYYSNSAGGSSGGIVGGGGSGGGQAASCDTTATLSSGLVDYWRFDDTGSTLIDSVTGGVNGSLNGGTIANSSCISGSCLSNSSSSTYGGLVPYNSRFNLTTNVSYNVWVKLNGTISSYWPRIMARNTHIGYGFRQQNATMNVYFEYGLNNGCLDQSGKYTSTAGYTIPDTTNWHMLTMTYDGANINFYVDAVRRSGPISFAANFCSDPTNLILGEQINGYVDDAKIYSNHILTGGFPGSEISNLYNNGTGCFP